MKRQERHRKLRPTEPFPMPGVRPPRAPEELRAPTLAAAKRALRTTETLAHPLESRPMLPMRWLWLAAMVTLTLANLSLGWSSISPMTIQQGSSPFTYLPADEAWHRLRAYDPSLSLVRAADLQVGETHIAPEGSR